MKAEDTYLHIYKQCKNGKETWTVYWEQDDFFGAYYHDGFPTYYDAEDSPVAVGISMTCIILWIISAGTAVFTHLFFSDDYSKHKLEYLTTIKHEQLVKQCPNEE